MNQTKKIQLRGNCPCCGSDQAVVNGYMSKHGYTVKHGWFEGVCPGHQFRPMQQDRTVTDKIVADVRAEVANLMKLADNLREGKVFPKHIERRGDRIPGKFQRETILVPFAEGEQWEKEAAVTKAVYATENRARAGASFAKDMEALVNKVHGQPLREVQLEKPTIQVGSAVKVHGHIVTVTKIGYAVCHGVGPALNGKSVEHVYWTDEKGNERKYPKRFARLA